jgi:Tfp pilus assembly protein PilV
MVALCTMAIALMAVMGLHLSSLRADVRNRDESRALFLANQKLEELRSQHFSNIVNGEDSAAYPFELTWTVTATQAWRKDLVVTVSWPERISSINGNAQTKQRSVQVATIIADLN